MIRILLHADILGIGGLERKVSHLALHLDRSRFEPIVSYSKHRGPYADELERAGIPVERIVPCSPRHSGASQATARIRELAPRIFHSFSCRKNAFDVLTARHAGVPIIVTARDNARYWAPPGPPRNWEFDRNAATQYVTACCELAADLARTIEGVHAEKVVAIHNGVEIPVLEGPSIREELAIPQSAFLAGYAAKYRPLKAHETLLRAWKRVAAMRPDALLVCCGEDEDGRLDRLRCYARELGLENNVWILESRANMAPFYRGLDLYVHASSTEGFSMAILEAMSYALPVVATNVGGTGEAIEDACSGILVACDPRSIADGVSKLIDSPSDRRALGDAARQRVRQTFSLVGMVRKYESFYERAAAEAPVMERRASSALTLTGAAEAPRLESVTVFVTTIGDAGNFSDCMAHLAAQTVRCPVEIVDRVAPMSAAFAQMHARCKTEFYVQVDEDMQLYPDALARLHELISQSGPSTPMVCAPLWDCDVQRPLLGVKIYRHEIVKRFPYRDSLSCEVVQLQAMEAAGHRATILPCEEPDAVCLGEHGKHYTPQSIFKRWQRLFHKRNELGGLLWLAGWPERLLDRYLETRDRIQLYALLGAVAGIAGGADGDGELDWRDANRALIRLEHYFPGKTES